MQINMIEDKSKQFTIMEYMSTFSKFFAVILRQVAFYLTVVADFLDKNEMIKTQQDQKRLENVMAQAEDSAERNRERYIKEV